MFSYFPRELQITGTEQDNAALSGEKWGVKCAQSDLIGEPFSLRPLRQFLGDLCALGF